MAISKTFFATLCLSRRSFLQHQQHIKFSFHSRKMAHQKFKVALVQLLTSADKASNLRRASEKIAEAVKNGAQMVVLPEIFNAPYGNQYFAQYAEPIPGTTTENLQEAAKNHKIYLIGGSIAESDGDKLYNTCTMYDPTGRMVGVHRKVHMFDIDVPGGIKFTESETLSPGNHGTIFETDFGKIGVGICYDVRFAELATLYARQDCKFLIYPGAFNMTTGPAHWELLARARAVDNQVYVALCSGARDTEATYVEWGHSTVVDPWGTVIAKAEEKETIIYADIDFEKVDKIRQMIPISTQRRKDIYDTILKGEMKTVK